MSPLPLRLAAAAPTGGREADVVVVGSGVAGLSAALAAATTRRVLLVCKGALADGATGWAQGGIAAALGPGDSPAEHLSDTLVAGAGLCDPDAVRVLVTEGPERVRALARLGARFDGDEDGPALTREGGHRRDRVVHAGGDATGREVLRALAAAVLANPRIEVVEHAFALDLALGAGGQVVGLTLAEGGRVQVVRARAVLLATGGLGQLFPATTNPAVATGDGVAMALRAGAAVADLEFVQFHPTVLVTKLVTGAVGPAPRVLVTEALRGEGAVLLDATGAAVMRGVHPLGDLAPRDVVAKAMTERMAQAPGGVGDRLFLDATALGSAVLERRFPTVLAACRAAGVEPVYEPIPVAPAAHYASGGICTDLAGATSVPGLYAVGETACTGVHGANRLASNSLLEGLVFGARVGSALGRTLPARREPAEDVRTPGVVTAAARAELVAAVGAGAGIVRTDGGLRMAAARLAALGADLRSEAGTRPDWEATNLLTVATALVAAAAARRETRGCHWRVDFPASSPGWEGHLRQSLERSGRVDTQFCPAGEQAA
ncbi:MAG: L-aspartate oxidase [Mycobacteriales bacterium]